MTDQPDLLIIGAGPAGMQAALTARKYNLSVVVLDEQPTPGGQIYRNIMQADTGKLKIAGQAYAAGKKLAESFLAAGITYFPNSRVWQIEQGPVVYAVVDGISTLFEPKRLLLATGAMERPAPSPGWTLPGVMAAGAAQILLKSAGLVPDGQVVLAGSGPLLYLVGQQLLLAGVKPTALIDTTPQHNRIQALKYLPRALASWKTLLKGVDLLNSLRRANIPIYGAATHLAFKGENRLTHVTFQHRGKSHSISANIALIHQGIVPDTQITRALRIPHRWSDQQLCWLPETTNYGELADAPGIFIAGDAAFIAGADAARLQGEIAALTIAEQLGALTLAQREAAIAVPFSNLTKWQHLRKFLDTLYRPIAAQRIPEDDVLVCRCEEISARAIRDFVKVGCRGPNQAKSFGRCGMGPCQGRECALTITEIIAAARNVDVKDIEIFRARFPIKPVRLKDLII